ncbi:MFS transporter [Streptomyces dysideae]|uniref:Uncharacterized protein n=1 Tax=Streptomyces dysideae TaxID=909626 RepID=A0A101UPH4_9ACTN|nr:MFS transporter [Streptomyces dysideae]KUO14381.1 hypothetical protein AQJ91_47200 [Streptomyces dysideae]
MKFLGDVSEFSPSAVSALFAAFGVACLAGVSMLGLYSVGSDPVAAVVFLVLMGGALGPAFMTTQNAMLHCAPGRTDIALAANSGFTTPVSRRVPRAADWSCRWPTRGAPSSSANG